MSEQTGDDVPRDPWGNPLGPEDRAPVDPQPDDFPPPFPSDPPGGVATPPPWGGEQPPQEPPFNPPANPPANPAWPGAKPGPPAPPAPPFQPGQQGQPGQPGPGWGGPGVPPQQPYYPPGAYQGYGQGTPWAPPKNDSMAIGGLVCAILSITCAGFLGIILGPVGLVLGLNSRRRIRASNGGLRGEGMALAATVIGAIGIVASIAYLGFLIANPNFVQDFLDRFTTTTTTGG